MEIQAINSGIVIHHKQSYISVNTVSLMRSVYIQQHYKPHNHHQGGQFYHGGSTTTNIIIKEKILRTFFINWYGTNTNHYKYLYTVHKSKNSFDRKKFVKQRRNYSNNDKKHERSKYELIL
jgi:hypothetical protein